MDAKDFLLLAALHRDARQSYRSLGRAVRLSAPAVRERVRRLEASGVLPGYGLWIDPGVFGLEEALVFFGRERNRQEVTRVLASPNVAWVGWQLEPGMTVGVWSEDTIRSIKDLASLLGEESLGHAVTAHTEHHPLSSVDLAIVDDLIDDPRVAFKQLVESTALSPKTVRKHLESLFESEVLQIIPRQAAVSGELVYQIAVAGTETVSRLRGVVPDAVLLHQTSDPPMKYLLCRSAGLADVSEKTRSLRSLPGVRSAVISMNRELLFSSDFLHSLVRRQTRKLKKNIRLA